MKFYDNDENGTTDGGKSIFYPMPISAPPTTAHSNDDTLLMQQQPDDDQPSVSIIDDLMRSWEARYCTYLQLSVFVGTYNVNGQTASEDLSSWLTDCIPSAPDLYVLGFQELDLSQQAFIFDSTAKEAEWALAVRRCLNPGRQYVELKRVRLVGILLIVYIADDKRDTIRPLSLQCLICPTGFLNRMGNKGGVAVSVRIDDTTLCFINSHLAAGNDELQRRNQDFRDISRSVFATRPFGIFDHDVTIWMGDLNYRLELPNGHSLDNSEVRRICATGEHAKLLKYDQLVKMQKAKTAFHDFSEGAITFPPTYKYDTGSDNWDSSEKLRIPAWCDRILWMSRAAIVQQQMYSSIAQLRISDHKPVFSLFSIKVKRIDQAKWRSVHEEAIREADRRVNESLPQIQLDHTEFDFGRVKFMEANVRALTLKNLSKYPVAFKFVKHDRSNAAASRSDWLTVTPDAQRIDKGCECIVELQMLVTKQAAWQLNAGSMHLRDVLVLRLVNGRDYFICIDGDYEPSCFGQSLMHLMQVPAPAENLLIDLFLFQSDTPAMPDDNLPVPRQLWRLVDCLLQNGIDSPGLFNEPAPCKDFIAIRNALDTGLPDNLSTRCSLFSVFEALLRFIDSLPEPIIPIEHQAQCLQVCTDPVACWRAIERVNTVHKQCFIYLLKFLQQMNAAKNDASNVGIDQMFADLFFKTDSHPATATVRSARDRVEQEKARTFLRNCLQYDRETVLQWQS